jgi:hypothetical protein
MLNWPWFLTAHVSLGCKGSRWANTLVYSFRSMSGEEENLNVIDTLSSAARQTRWKRERPERVKSIDI